MILEISQSLEKTLEGATSPYDVWDTLREFLNKSLLNAPNSAIRQNNFQIRDSFDYNIVEYEFRGRSYRFYKTKGSYEIWPSGIITVGERHF